MSNCKHPCCGSICRKPKKARKIYHLRRAHPLKRKKPIKREFIPRPYKEELDAFFDKCCEVIASWPYCDECNAYIPSIYYRSAVAHIFPKKKYISVGTHMCNWLKLGPGCGCHDKTHTLESFSKMRIFPTAVRQFREFEHLITEKGKYLNLFREYADQQVTV